MIINDNVGISNVRRAQSADLEAIQYLKARALEMYQQSNLTSKQIAQMCSTSPSALTVWAKHEGLALRGRGRRKYDEPTPMQMRILRHAWKYTYEEVAHAFGKQKQGVWRLVKRWHSWAEREFGPRSVIAKKAHKKEKTIKIGPRTLQPNVISFRISDSVLAKILAVRGYKDQFRSRSLHYVARELLLAGIEHGQRTVTSGVEPIQT